jgi:hypothetical protein
LVARACELKLSLSYCLTRLDVTSSSTTTGTWHGLPC